MKGINRAIVFYTLSIFFFLGLIIFLAIYLTNVYIKNSIRNIYEDSAFMIDIDPKIDKNLEILDENGEESLVRDHIETNTFNGGYHG